MNTSDLTDCNGPQQEALLDLLVMAMYSDQHHNYELWQLSNVMP